MTSDSTRKFEDLIAAAVEQTDQEERTREAEAKAREEARIREVLAHLKSVLEGCLDPVIGEAAAMRYEYANNRPEAVLTVDGETWRIWEDPDRNSVHWGRQKPPTYFLFAAPGQSENHHLTNVEPRLRPTRVSIERLQMELLSAIAKHRKQRTEVADDIGERSYIVVVEETRR